jgi:hypothetical protein
VCAVMTYGGSVGVAPFVLTVGTRWSGQLHALAALPFLASACNRSMISLLSNPQQASCAVRPLSVGRCSVKAMGVC